jgi:hypothetical protein
MTAPAPDGAARAGRVPLDVPSAGARVPVGLFEPVLRGSARPPDPERRTTPVHAHPRPLDTSSPADPVPDEPPHVGVPVRAEPAGLGNHRRRAA